MLQQSPDRAEFITFYSYKGGVGRSMAVLNVGSLLASRGFGVLIIDFDLEAPGLTHLNFSQPNNPRANKQSQASKTKGLVELLTDAKTRGESSDLISKNFKNIARKYTFTYNIPPELNPRPEGQLSIMPSGQIDPTYAERLDYLDLGGLYRDGVGALLINTFKDKISSCGIFDYVIVDSRTGHSDEAGICTRDLADHLMVVTGFNRQNLHGTASFLNGLRSSLKKEGRITPPDVILSPVPIGEEALLSEREIEASKLFADAWGEEIPMTLSIPYHPRLALTEDAYVTTRTTSYLKKAYKDIELKLLDSIGHSSGNLWRRVVESIESEQGRAALNLAKRARKLDNIVTTEPTDSHLSWYYFTDRLKRPFLGLILKLDEAEELLDVLSESPGASWHLARLFIDYLKPGATNTESLDDIFARLKHIDPSAYIEYADYLAFTQEHDRAERFFLLALKDAQMESNPTLCGRYGIFLYQYRLKPDLAIKYYKVDWQHNPVAIASGNYGQMLIANGIVYEGLQLLEGITEEIIQSESTPNMAELAFSAWIATLILGKPSPNWESLIKHLLEVEGVQTTWNFDAILGFASTILDADEFNYASAIGSRLKERKTEPLSHHKRWLSVEPVSPNAFVRQRKKLLANRD